MQKSHECKSFMAFQCIEITSDQSGHIVRYLSFAAEHLGGKRFYGK
jgi:hypothetical protein